MNTSIRATARTAWVALRAMAILTVVLGVGYTLVVTGIGQILFPAQANGSLVVDAAGEVVGSSLIGQSFTEPGHFWGRPSATAPMPYNAAASGGSNQGPTNPALADAVKARIEALRAADPGNTHPVPVDLVTASASGYSRPVTRDSTTNSVRAGRIRPPGLAGTSSRGIRIGIRFSFQ